MNIVFPAFGWCDLPTNTLPQARAGSPPRLAARFQSVALLLVGLGLFTVSFQEAFAQELPPPPPPQTGGAWIGIVGDDGGNAAGVRVEEIRQNGPALQAGLQVGDLITGAAGLELRTLEDLVSLLSDLEPGNQVELNIVRAGRRRTINLTLAERPGDLPPAADGGRDPQTPSQTTVRPYLGLRVGSNPEVEGAVVERVEAGSPAHLGGLRPGNVVVSLNGRAIRSAEDMAVLMAAARPGQELDIGYLADGRRQVATVRLGPISAQAPEAPAAGQSLPRPPLPRPPAAGSNTDLDAIPPIRPPVVQPPYDKPDAVQAPADFEPAAQPTDSNADLHVLLEKIERLEAEVRRLNLRVGELEKQVNSANQPKVRPAGDGSSGG